ncbi:MalY/PatB family protein [Phaeobacter gallaeciensis]|uniref:MalY/PatB family protein n=1 Tax=Phaeobacter gallaeciensis TaxID=60890 RepID=UPI00237FCBCC|nr:aminotransferase class I/II-fold pyridoxal phosphate-dependent enzyme [Phaeobacter gallaeciensis]MDE4142843.1 aminotransferase class I/II-fold pyridoxal phosphate-dependent enzyme [Phaeobacter gallaeciensis]MDE4151288.1 aminotransferase class I/II-fold pyridoxal phosphate-dependent enzyme [Phaeobacter gallaeciensis]MDE4155545.1 aminotransferase class I/II-fold pyridoxal phosphate-dependent enzyme [Phaeobacter gallaeciensis]MDE4230910.1 aminotransferase class I/II-fold pyridoxal phosphate-dep
MNIATPTFQFDQIIDRRGSNSMKWDGGKAMLAPEEAAADPLPMWVADMDFRAPQPVIDALVETAERGVFGYPAGGTESYLAAVTGWQKKRFGWDVDWDWVVPSAGIITAIKTIVQAFSAPGDSVLIQPPVYGHFRDDVLLNGRVPVSAPLTRTNTGYRYDPAVFEAAIQPNTKLFILSNPHNPTGNVWSADELRSMGEICERHGILVVSDEIHQDLIMNPALRHIPFASLGEGFARNSITCTAPSKTFNLPGVQCANLFIPDARLRAEFRRQYDRNMFPLLNVMGMVACEAAYTHGTPWLEGLLSYVCANHAHFARSVHGMEAGLVVSPADSLYLA